MSINNCSIRERNEKVEKVSVIYMNGSHDTTISVPVTEINSDSDVRTYSTTRHKQASGLNETKLAKALRPPKKQNVPKPPSRDLYMGRIFLCIFYLCAKFTRVCMQNIKK